MKLGDFMREMHQIRIRMGSRPRHRWITHSAPADTMVKGIAGEGEGRDAERRNDIEGGNGIGKDRQRDGWGG